MFALPAPRGAVVELGELHRSFCFSDEGCESDHVQSDRKSMEDTMDINYEVLLCTLFIEY
jgi:hypothetical protein